MKQTTKVQTQAPIKVQTQAQPITAKLVIEQLHNKRELTINSYGNMNKVTSLLSAKFETIKALFGTAKNKYFDATKEAPIMFNLSLNNGNTDIEIKGNINSNNASAILLEINRYCASTLLQAPVIDYLEIEIAKLDDKEERRNAKIENRAPILKAPKLEREMKYKPVQLSNIFVS